MFRDPAATERLARHASEVEVDNPVLGQQQRAIGTGAVVGLVPPAYLTDQFAELARAGRPVANAVTSLPLPESGMTVNISRVTTGTSAASQSTENSAVSETNADDTLLIANVVTIAGQQTVSRQALERGQLVEEVFTADLANAHNAELDRQVINGSGASGQRLGILGTSGIISVTYTDASPTAQELWPKLVDAVQQIPAQRFTRATHLVVNPLLWGWRLSTLDTTGRPLFEVGGSESGFNTMGASDTAGLTWPAGCSAARSSSPATCPRTSVAARTRPELSPWTPGTCSCGRTTRCPCSCGAEQPSAASLGVLFVAYSFSAFTAGRQPKAISAVSGTGADLAGAVMARQEKPATPLDERVRAEIAALLVERAGYVARRLPDRVAAVDAQIKARGGKPPSS